jgi:hypothetical protein
MRLRLAVSLLKGAYVHSLDPAAHEFDAEFVGMTRFGSMRRQRTTPSTSWFGPASAILANSAS